MNANIVMINNHVESISIDESLASLLREKMKVTIKDSNRAKDYFNVVELVNPAPAFWSAIHPNVQKAPELRRRLAKGRQLQKKASIWLRALPDFIAEEGKIDGAWVGVRGVRGSIDYRVAESIIELKTKNEIPSGIEEIFSLYPHDLEQLAFYSVLHPSHPNENYIIFMKNVSPFDLKVFKVTIKDFGRLKTLILSRIADLKSAIEIKDSSKLGRCRYYKGNCQFLENKICNCDNAPEMPIKILKDSIELEYDEGFTMQLESNKTLYKELDSFSPWDIIAPRLNYMRSALGEEKEYKSDAEKEDYEACLWASINNLPIALNRMDRDEIIKSTKEPRIYANFRWAKIKNSASPDDEIIPYVEKVSGIDAKSRISLPSPFYLADLGVRCAAYGKSKGLIFILYPKLNKFVQVFNVTFKDVTGLLKEIRGGIKSMENAKIQNDVLLLPACPEFLNYDKKCPMTGVCHSKAGSGCIKNLIMPKNEEQKN